MNNTQLETTPIFKPINNSVNTIDCIIGEVVWHSLTNDTSIVAESDAHYDNLVPILDRLVSKLPTDRPLRILELAAYSHITGYKITKNYNAEVILADISPDTLVMGEKIANELYPEETNKKVQRWAVDFHELPFEENTFDLVFISSALHHTWEWEVVVKQMQRVTAPSGQFYFYNEPCMREFCFYKFRSNRPHDLSDFEKQLDAAELFRTISEPYLGTRPEALFGMIENQTIVLDDFVALASELGSIAELTVAPEICMGTFEHKLVAERNNGVKYLEEAIYAKVSNGISNIPVGPAEVAMKMCLPTIEEVQLFSKAMAARLAETLHLTDGQVLRVELAKIFGGAINLLVNKSSTQGVEANRPSAENYNIISGVVRGYPLNIYKLLTAVKDLVPDVQTEKLAELNKTFRPEEWQITRNEDTKLRALLAIKNGSKITVETNEVSENIQILARLYCGYLEVPYKLIMTVNGKTVKEYEVYKNDSILFRHSKKIVGNEVLISFKATDVNDIELVTMPPVVLSAIRLFSFELLNNSSRDHDGL